MRPSLHPVPGGAVATWTRGSGPPLALVHGGTGTGHHDWAAVLPSLARHRTVVLMDMQGHGMSPSREGRIGLVRYGLDVASVMQRIGFPTFAAAGFSMGANSMIHLAFSQPWRLTHLVTIGASVESRPERVADILSGPWPRELRHLRHVAHPDQDHWEWLRERLATDWADNVRFTDEELARIAAPVLAIHGADDVIVDRDQAAMLVAAVGNGKDVDVPGAGHAVARDQPDVVAELMHDFLTISPDGPGDRQRTPRD